MASQPTDPADCACFNTRRTARLLGQFYDRMLEPSGLRNTQFSLLAALIRRGPTTITDLARATDIERTTLTRNLRVLERDGLVSTRAGADRRSKRVATTGAGARRFKAALPLWQDAQLEVVKGLGSSRWRALRAELDTLRANIPAS